MTAYEITHLPPRKPPEPVYAILLTDAQWQGPNARKHLERTVIPLLEALGHKPTLGRVQDFNQRKDRNCV